jgi:serine/threonine protein kinase
MTHWRACSLKGKQRYEIRGKLGEGGMGVVYLAFDRDIKREVALKTVRDIQSAAQLELFYKECGLLKSLSHPNIVQLFDIGEDVFEEEGGKKPFFVMPLLRGVTLQKLIKTASRRLTIARSVDIISQACRGLQAAHEAGLVHRDIKPSNIFVLEDDSVNIIDFGIARDIKLETSTGWKGTLAYMSPEQVELKTVDCASDIFSLGVVAYETLTRKRPFAGKSERDVKEAILYYMPPPVSKLNPEISQILGCVIHKAIAKKPYHRYASPREFADFLQKAMRNEMIDTFDPARIQPRIERATQAFESGDYQFASEIMGELESEGHFDPAISNLRARVEQVARQKRVQRLIGGARSRLEEGEYPLALQKIQEIFEIDPENAEAMGLRRTIESKRTVEKIDEWFRLARQHIDNFSFDFALQAVENILSVNPGDAQAHKLLVEIQRKEQDYLKLKQEKEQLFHVAQESWQKGDVTGALSKLERVLQLERLAPDRATPGHKNSYLALYNEVRSESDQIGKAYTEGRKHLADGNLAKAKAVCDQFLAKYPSNALFQAMRFDVEERQRQEGSAFIAETDRRVEAEPNLAGRVAILEEALKRYPGEAHFERALRMMREKWDFIQSIVAAANRCEDQEQFTEAIGQWEILKTVYQEYPGLEFEIERLTKRKDQQKQVQEKAHWVEQIDQSLEAGDYAKALEASQSAQLEFSGSAELAQLEKLATEGIEKGQEARKLLVDAQTECGQKNFDKGIELLRRAYDLDARNATVRRLLADTLVEKARTIMDSDQKTAENLIQQALVLDINHVQARGFRTLMLDRRKNEFIDQCRAHVRQFQANGDIHGAVNAVDQALARFPGEQQLTQLRANLSRHLGEERSRDLDRLRHLVQDAEASSNASLLLNLSERARDIGRNYPGDADVASLISKIQRRVRTLTPLEKEQVPAENHLAETPLLQPKRVKLISLIAPLFPRIAGQVREWIRRFSFPQERAGSEESSTQSNVPLRRRVVETLRRICSRPAYWCSALAAIVLLLVVVLMIGRIYRARVQNAPFPPADVLVTFFTDPAEAEIIIDGKPVKSKDGVLLSPGKAHVVTAMMEGYLPVRDERTLEASTPKYGWRVPRLYPCGATLKLVTDVQTDILLDNSKLQQTEREKNNLSTGLHSLTFIADSQKAQIDFTSVPGSLPDVSKIEYPNSLFAVAVSTFRNSMRIYTKPVPRKYKLLQSVDPQTELTDAIKKDSEMLIAENLKPGKYTLRLGTGDQARDLDVEVGAVPVLSIQAMQLTSGTLSITAVTQDNGNQLSGINVYIDDEQYKQQTNSSRLMIPLEGGKSHKVQLDRLDGYITPEPQMVDLRRGETKRIQFTYIRQIPEKPKMATLKFMAEDVHVNTRVLVDEKELGLVSGKGEIIWEIAAGVHRIKLEKDKHTHKEFTKDFKNGESVELTAKEVELFPDPAKLTITVSPQGTAVKLKIKSGEQGFENMDLERTLHPGWYTVQAEADGYGPWESTFYLKPGENRDLLIELMQQNRVFGMERWQQRWEKQENNWFSRKGGSFATYQNDQKPGVYTFSWCRICSPAGKKRLGFLPGKEKVLRWAVAYTDPQNLLSFEFNGKKLTRSELTNGKESRKPEKSIAAGKEDVGQFGIRITVEQNRVRTEIMQGEHGGWITLDDWQVSGRDLLKGQFAFDLKREDEIYIRDFRFQPQLKK